MGDGLKYETTKFFPINPPQICRDPEEKFTSSEPQPTDEAIQAYEARLASKAKRSVQQEEEDD